MNERLLQFIWQWGLFDKSALISTKNEVIQIIHLGTLNLQEGPDFTNAQIIINGIKLVGNIELHLHQKDWLKHQHQKDVHYQNIILHVVYYPIEQEIELGNFATLILSPCIRPSLLKYYESLQNQRKTILCHQQIHRINPLFLLNYKERLIVEKWDLKNELWKQLLIETKQDWNTILYYALAYNFGFNNNNEAMLALAKSIPLHILWKHADQPTHIIAMLLGQAGFLTADMEEEYAKGLYIHYEFYKKKYQLTPILTHQWKFMKVRPTNFPTIRIAQFSNIIRQQQHFFHTLIESNDLQAIRNFLYVETDNFWDTHYHLKKSSKSVKKTIGENSIDNLIINTIFPLRYLYLQSIDKSEQIADLIELLEKIKPEKNTITSEWQSSGLKNENAFDSQSLIHLYKRYCTQQKCLDCNIGLKILKDATLM